MDNKAASPKADGVPRPTLVGEGWKIGHANERFLRRNLYSGSTSPAIRDVTDFPEICLLKPVWGNARRLPKALYGRKAGMPEGNVFTVVRLADGARLERACELAGIQPIHVDLIQSMAEKVDPAHLQADFRVISYDGQQITISERIKGERAVKGFAVGEQIGANEPPSTKTYLGTKKPA